LQESRDAAVMHTMKKTARKKKRRIESRFALKIGRSRTGLGVYADEPIKRGVRIAEYTGRPLKPGEEYTSRSKFLFKISRTKTIDGTVKSNAARYFNHSCAPNCRAENTGRRIYIVSRRYIDRGEELTYHYGKEYFDQHIGPKGCRCLKCEPVELVLY
jgi:SET domain-containing protein